MLALERGRQRVGGLIDVLGRLQHLLRGPLGAGDDSVQFAGGTRHLRAPGSIGVERRHLAAGALDRIIDLSNSAL